MNQFQFGTAPSQDPSFPFPPIQNSRLPPAPPEVLTTEQESSAAISRAAAEPNLWTALTQQTTLNDIADFAVRKWIGGETEPEWRHKHDLKVLLEGVPPQFHDDLLGESSYLDALNAKDSISMKMAAADKVSRYGTAGSVAQFGVSIVEFAPIMAVLLMLSRRAQRR